MHDRHAHRNVANAGAELMRDLPSRAAYQASTSAVPTSISSAVVTPSAAFTS